MICLRIFKLLFYLQSTSESNKSIDDVKEETAKSEEQADLEST